MENVTEEGESFPRFFPELEDVKVWVWQVDGAGQPAGGVRVIDRDDFPLGWNVLCGDGACPGVFDPRGVVYAAMHGRADRLEGSEQCQGVGNRLKARDGAGGCGRNWQYSVRLLRRWSENETGGAAGQV
jgi:hypothetical protein